MYKFFYKKINSKFDDYKMLVRNRLKKQTNFVLEKKGINLLTKNILAEKRIARAEKRNASAEKKGLNCRQKQ